MINPISPQLVEKIRQNVDQQRLLDTAMTLIDIPSPTLSAGKVADQLASLLQDDGFEVERPVANWPEAPAVVVSFETGRPGRVWQVDGGGAAGNRRLYEPTQKIGGAPCGILGGKLDIGSQTARERHVVDHRLQALLARDAELALKMQVRSSNERVNACTLRRLHRLGDTLNVRTIAAGESGDHRTFDL